MTGTAASIVPTARDTGNRRIRRRLKRAELLSGLINGYKRAAQLREKPQVTTQARGFRHPAGFRFTLRRLPSAGVLVIQRQHFSDWVVPVSARSPVLVTSIESAELLKVSDDCFISMKIVCASMLAELCEHAGADCDEVTSGASGQMGNPAVGCGAQHRLPADGVVVILCCSEPGPHPGSEHYDDAFSVAWPGGGVPAPVPPGVPRPSGAVALIPAVPVVVAAGHLRLHRGNPGQSAPQARLRCDEVTGRAGASSLQAGAGPGRGGMAGVPQAIGSSIRTWT